MILLPETDRSARDAQGRLWQRGVDGHVKSVHADGMNECLAYHELTEAQQSESTQPCTCRAFVAPFNDTSHA